MPGAGGAISSRYPCLGAAAPVVPRNKEEQFYRSTGSLTTHSAIGCPKADQRMHVLTIQNICSAVKDEALCTGVHRSHGCVLLTEFARDGAAGNQLCRACDGQVPRFIIAVVAGGDDGE